VKPGEESSPAAVPIGAPGSPVRVRARRKARATRQPTAAPESSVRVRVDAPAPLPAPGVPGVDAAGSAVPALELPAFVIDDEMGAIFPRADRVVTHVDANGRQFVAAAARQTPDDIEAIAQRLAALFLRGG
jgi:hypothetical protein